MAAGTAGWSEGRSINITGDDRISAHLPQGKSACEVSIGKMAVQIRERRGIDMFCDYPCVYCVILSCARRTQSNGKCKIHKTSQCDAYMYVWYKYYWKPFEMLGLLLAAQTNTGNHSTFSKLYTLQSRDLIFVRCGENFINGPS